MKILILGAGIGQLRMIKKAKNMGHYVYACDRNQNAVAFEHADHPLVIDTSDVKRIIEVIEKYDIDGITTMASNLAPRSVAKVCEYYNKPAITYEAAVRATDKALFRDLFANNEIPLVPGGEAKKCKEAIDICNNLTYPLIFKPSDGSGCSGIEIVREESEVESAFSQVRQVTGNKVVIEKFYEDSLVFGVESLILDGKTYVIGIADKVVRKNPSIGTAGVTMPTSLDKDQIDLVKEVIEEIHYELNLNMGASHIDFVWGNGKPRVIDIGPRLAGGPLIYELIKKLIGVDMIKFVINQSLGKENLNIPKGREISKVGISRYFFAPSSGELRNWYLPSVDNNMSKEWRKRKGIKLERTKGNVSRLGFLTAISSSLKKAEERIHEISRKTWVETKNENSLKREKPIIYLKNNVKKEG